MWFIGVAINISNNKLQKVSFKNNNNMKKSKGLWKNPHSFYKVIMLVHLIMIWLKMILVKNNWPPNSHIECENPINFASACEA